MLYQVATAALSPGDIAVPIRAILNKNQNLRVILGEVSQINPKESSIVLLDGRQISYDQLIMAPGALYNYFGKQDWEQFAPSLKTISDALNVRERILLSLEEAEQLEDSEKRQSLLTYVFIGGGATGVEMAGAIAEIAQLSMRHGFRNIKEEEIRIYLVEAAPSILNSFPEPLGQKGKKLLEKLGVKVLSDTPVTRIEKNKVHLKVGSIETPNIIWAAGIKTSPLLDTLQVAQDKIGRVYVNSDLSVREYPNIFVLGDSAHFPDASGNPLPALASVTKQQGQFLSKTLSKDAKYAIKPQFIYKDKGKMATIGRAKAVAEIKGWKTS